MNKAIPAALVAGLMLVGCARTTRVESGGEVDLSTTPVDSRMLPGGTTIETRLDQELGTKTSKVGDSFSATVMNAVVAQNGATVVPAGAKIHGKVTGVDNSDRVGEAAVIKIDFEQLSMNGLNYPFHAKVTATNLETRGESREETLKKAGVGAAAGAVLGAVLSGGDLEKILLGGALGAAAGTAISLGMGDTEAVLPAGTRMTLQTTQTVTLR